MSHSDQRGKMERQHAIDTARNMLGSKIGKVVMEENKFPDRTLQLQLQDIDRESRKIKTIHDNEAKLFKHSRLIYNFEPTIVVERPPSPVHLQIEGSKDTPHYMTGLGKNRPQGHLAMPSIDAFTVQSRKKKNIWEDKYSENDLNRKFRSIIMESPPLTTEEQADLEKGWDIYRPVSRMEQIAQQKLKDKKQARKDLLATVRRPTSPQSTFITQMAAVNGSIPISRQSRRSIVMSRASTKYSDHASLLQKRPEKAPFELTFNPRQLEYFEKIRKKQKDKFHKTIKLT